MSEALGAQGLESVTQASEPVARVQNGVQQGALATTNEPLTQNPGETAEEFFLRVNDRTVYKTPDAAIAGFLEKENFINQLLAERQKAPQVQQQPVDPQTQFNAEIEAIAREIEQEYLNDPEYQGYEPAAIKAQARIDAKTQHRAEQRAFQRLQRTTREQQWGQTVATTPELNTPLAQEVFERFKSTYGVAPADPQHHLDLVHAEMFRRGMQPLQRTVSTAGVQGAVQQQVQQASQLFPNISGAGRPAAEIIPPHVQEQISYAQQRGASEADLQRIKEIGMSMDLTRFKGGKVG